MVDFIGYIVLSIIMLIVLRCILRSKIASNVWEQHPTKNPLKKWLLWHVRGYLPKILFWFHLLALVIIIISSLVFFPAYYAGNVVVYKCAQKAMLVVAILSVCFIDMARRYKTY